MAVERGAGATAGAARQVRIHELGAAARAPERRRLHGQTPLTSVAPERAAPHRSGSGGCERSSSRCQPRGCSLGHMSIGSIDFPTLLRAHVYVQGLILTEDDPSKLRSCYLGYGGPGRWEVREYMRVTGGGPREYRVVRGGSIQDVYRCAERGRANI